MKAVPEAEKEGIAKDGHSKNMRLTTHKVTATPCTKSHRPRNGGRGEIKSPDNAQHKSQEGKQERQRVERVQLMR